MGRNSRAAVGRYQAFLGFPATGILTEYERTFLTSSYDRAIVGGPQNAQIMATSGQGVRGLLLAYRQESLGVPAAPAAPAPAPQTTVVMVPPATEPTAEAETPSVAAVAETSKLPAFLPGVESPSMASHCNRVEIETAVDSGALTEASTGDPYRALGAEFCRARTFAVDRGDSLAASVQGFSMAEIEEQCEAFAPTMADHVARLVSQSPMEAAAELQDFAVGTGMPPAQLSANARICLGVGYRTDNAEVALASALVLVGLGEQAYGELVGHHLMRGFATAKRQDRGLEWLTVTLAALGSGADPLVSAGAESHVAVLETALTTISGGSAPVLQDASADASGGGFAMPGTVSE